MAAVKVKVMQHCYVPYCATSGVQHLGEVCVGVEAAKGVFILDERPVE